MLFIEVVKFKMHQNGINYTVWMKTPTGCKSPQQLFYDGKHWVTRTLRQAKIEGTFYQRFGDYLFLR